MVLFLFNIKSLTRNPDSRHKKARHPVGPFYIGLCVIPLELGPFLEQFSYSYFLGNIQFPYV